MKVDSCFNMYASYNGHSQESHICAKVKKFKVNIIFPLLLHTAHLERIIKLGLNHESHMDYFILSLWTLWLWVIRQSTFIFNEIQI